MPDDVTRTQQPKPSAVAPGTRTFGQPDGTGTFVPPGPPDNRPLPVIPGYELLEPIGHGGMGRVYRARQLATDRVVAIKLILAGELAGTAARGRFRSEITATAKLSHPHIVQLYEAGEAEGQAFLVCEYVPGGSLAAALDGTPWEARRAARLLVPLARAVAAAHAAGIVHRDLKPGNVLLSADGTPKLADFGIAKQIGDAAEGGTHTGAILGSPSYMAPEQVGRANTAGPAADVYGLGAILYELFTGRPPFKGKDSVETLDQVRTQEPVSPRVLQPKLPRDAETVCLKCLQKEPAKRYATAGALADDLERFLDGRPILARPVGGFERGWRWCRRNPAVAGLLAAVFISLAAGAAVSVAFAYQSRRNEDDAVKAKRESDANAGRAAQNERTASANAELAKENERKALGEADLARHLTYLARMSRAGDAMRSGSYQQVRSLLAQTTPAPGQPDYRGWEWHYLNNLLNARSESLPLPAAVSGDRAASRGGGGPPTLSEDGRYAVWVQNAREENPEAGEFAARRPRAARTTLTVVDLSAPDKVAWVKTKTDEQPGRPSFGGWVPAIAAAAGRVVWASDDVVRVLDLKTGAELRKWTLDGQSPWSVVPDPSGRYAAINLDLPKKTPQKAREDGDDDPRPRFGRATETERVTEVWDTATGTRTARVQTRPGEWLGIPVFSPDGTRLAAWTLSPVASEVLGRRRTDVRWSGLGVWDAATGKPVSHAENRSADDRGRVQTGFWDDRSPGPMRFAADGKTLFVATGRGIEVRDVAAGKILLDLPDLDGPVTNLVLSPDGKLLAAGQENGTIVLIDPHREAPNERVYGQSARVHALAFRPDSPVLVSVTAEPLTLRSHDLAGRGYRQLARVDTLQLVDNGLQLRGQGPPGRFGPRMRPSPDQMRPSPEPGFASADGRYEASWERRATLYLGDPNNPVTGWKEKVLVLRGQVSEDTEDTARALAKFFLPKVLWEKNQWLWMVGREFVVTESATKRQVVLPGTGTPGSLTPIRFTPDGRAFLGMVATPVGERVKVQPRGRGGEQRYELRLVAWNLETGKPEREIPVPPPPVPEEPRRSEPQLRFSPDYSKAVWLVPAAVGPDAPDRGRAAAGAVLAPAELHVWDVSPSGEFSEHTRHALAWASNTTGEVRASDVAWPVFGPSGLSNRWLVLNNWVFDLRDRRLLPPCRLRGRSDAKVVADDGTRLFQFDGDEVRVYDLRTGEEVVSLPLPVPGQYHDSDRSPRHEAGRLVFPGFKLYRTTHEEVDLQMGKGLMSAVKGRSVEFEYVLDGTPRGK